MEIEHEKERGTLGTIRLVWALILGVGLALGLLWVLVPGSAAEAQAVNPGFTVDLFHDRVWGVVDPGELVTVAGPGGAYGAARADASGFFWTPLWNASTGTEIDIDDGDVIDFYVDGALAATVTVRDVSGQVDVVNDRVTGHIAGVPAGTPVTVTLKPGAGGEPDPGMPQATTTTDSSGNFSADFSGSVNIAPRHWATVDYVAGSIVRDHLTPAGVFFVDSYGSVRGYARPRQTVTATIYVGTGSVDEVVDGTADGTNGDYRLAPSSASLDPGDLVEVNLGGGTVISTVVASLGIQVNAGADVVSGTAPAGEPVRVFFGRWEDGEYHYYEVNTTASVGGTYAADFGGQADLPRHEWVNVGVSDAEGDETTLWGGDTFIEANAAKDVGWARVDAGGVPVTATLDTGSNTYTWNGTSHPVYRSAGDFWFDDGGGGEVDIQAGHVITVESPTWSDSMTVAGIVLDVDRGDDRVTGSAPAGHAEIYAGQWESWRYPINGEAVRAVTLASPFDVAFDDFDLRFGGWIDFNHFNEDGHKTFAHFEPPYIEVQIPYGVGGNASEPGEAVTATLYSSDGIQKAQNGNARYEWEPTWFWIDGWGDVDFEPGDWVTVAGASGWEAGVQVVDLSVAADYASDRMWGQGPVGLLYAHWDNYPGPDGQDGFVPTDGSGDYAIDWSVYGADVLPGHSMRIYYIAPDGNQVALNVPQPNLWVNKQSEGQPAVGGNFAYWIDYGNGGHADATNVVLTDTLPAGTSYVADSSSLPAHVSGGVITWALGTVPVDSHTGFLLVTQVGSGAGDPLQNQVEIYTADDDYFGDNSWTQEDDLQTPDVDLRVDKWNHGDWPAPGNDFTYIIDYRNDGGTGSGFVTLTDTLPMSTTYVSWFSRDPLWTLASTVGNRVVFTRPVVPGWGADQLRLTLHLGDEVQEGTPLTDVVEIATSNETGGTANNEYTLVTEARDPRLDVGLDKRFQEGTTVAGHELTYRIDYRNHSNTPAYGVRITDTLPAGTTFVTSTREVWQSGDWQGIPFAPALVTSSQVAWDLGTLNPGQDSDVLGAIRLVLRINPGVASGTVLTNEAEIAPTIIVGYADDDPRNNREQVAVTVRNPGPNLMIVKDGHLNDNLRYDINFFNVGTTRIDGFTITDTYPLSTTFSDGQIDWGGNITFTSNPADRQAIWQVNESIGPGQNGGGRLEVNIDPAIERGRLLTNVIQISVPPGDVDPTNNTYTLVKGTGPDLYVEKTASSPWVNAGDLLTFTLSYGNRAERGEDHTDWGGTVWLTDTLPGGLAYVTSTQRFCGEPECPPFIPDFVGNQLVFDVGPQGDGWWNEIYLTVRVTDTAQKGDVFTNSAEIASSNPVDDVEPYYDNNTGTKTVRVTDVTFQIGKTWTGNRVAGTVLTYTLTVTNLGSDGGTGVIVRDTVPTGLTYGHGNGTLAGGDVTWTFDVGANGGSASGWFNGTLPCTAGSSVVNATYGVYGSEQGVSGPMGTSVGLTVLAPTIDADFEQSTSTPDMGETIYFTDTSTSNGAPIVAWEWDFDDGRAHAFTQNASHAYSTGGTFAVRLTVTDTCGYSATATGPPQDVPVLIIFLPLVMR
jgi:uncharacterized repeat protein (TIGR01451 family)